LIPIADNGRRLVKGGEANYKSKRPSIFRGMQFSKFTRQETVQCRASKPIRCRTARIILKPHRAIGANQAINKRLAVASNRIINSWLQIDEQMLDLDVSSNRPFGFVEKVFIFGKQNDMLIFD
jgi:hypothetical protein